MNSYGKFDEYVKLAVSNSKNASEIVAISFYRILRKNGFNNNEIINVANNILECLIQTLESYKERAAETKVQPPTEVPAAQKPSADQETLDACDTNAVV